MLCRLVAVAVTSATVVVGAANSSYASVESGYLSILNQERTSHGLAALHLNAELTGVAQSWASRMAATGSLQHNPALTREVHHWRSLGENVGDGPNLRDITDAFWTSAEHRDNILDPDFTQVGIAAVIVDHRIWIAVEFREPMHYAARASQQRGVSRTTARAYPGSLLMRGTRGPAVAYVQRLLGLRDSGVFGARTQKAVLTFQRRHHLGVDGIVGPITWSALVRARS
jgi:peptidoglycan hydrolase-like protein with peptidoglycan-binding domain